MRRFALVAMTTLVMAGGASAAQSLQVVRDEPGFVNIVVGKQLTRFGIRLRVTDDGAIRGRAFGRDVTGEWRWQNGYFCRELFYGDRELGANCQEVAINGSTVRFTSDRGEGIFADFELR